MPSDTRFWNRIARKYATRPVANPAAYEEKLARTAARLAPTARVLEFGCGTGTRALHHASRVAQIDGIDFSSEMIAIAREKATAAGVGNVTFSVSRFEDWEPQPYDMVMAHSVLHLVADLDATLAHVRRRLPSGGLFVSSTTCIRDMSAILPLVLPLGGALGLIPKVLPLRASGLLSRIEAAGFEIEETWRPGPRDAIFLIARAI